MFLHNFRHREIKVKTKIISIRNVYSKNSPLFVNRQDWVSAFLLALRIFPLANDGIPLFYPSPLPHNP